MKDIDDSGLSGFGRFSEPALLIMISLAEGPKHGYAMIEDIHGVAGVRMGPGRSTAPSPVSRRAA